MPGTDYYNSGDKVPANGDYTTFCCNRTLSLIDTKKFPNCPTCQKAASWRPST